MAPGGSGLIVRRWQLCWSVLRRLAPGGTRPPPGGLEAVAPSGTCPPLGDLAAVSPSWWCFKGKIAGFLQLSSERIP